MPQLTLRRKRQAHYCSITTRGRQIRRTHVIQECALLYYVHVHNTMCHRSGSGHVGAPALSRSCSTQAMWARTDANGGKVGEVPVAVAAGVLIVGKVVMIS
jgi:hypothetical protein